METWDHREAEFSSLFSNSWPRWVRLSEREQSQLVLDQVLIQSCKPAPIYTQFLTCLVKLGLTYIRCPDNGYNSEPDWYKLSVGVSGLVCVVIFVHQSRLSVSPSDRLQLLRSLQFSIFRISLVNCHGKSFFRCKPGLVAGTPHILPFSDFFDWNRCNFVSLFSSCPATF